MLDRVETVIWRAIHAVAGRARDTGPCPVIELTSSGTLARTHRHAAGKSCVDTDPRWAWALRFFTRGSVIGGESCVFRR